MSHLLAASRLHHAERAFPVVGPLVWNGLIMANYGYPLALQSLGRDWGAHWLSSHQEEGGESFGFPVTRKRLGSPLALQSLRRRRRVFSQKFLQQLKTTLFGRA